MSTSRKSGRTRPGNEQISVRLTDEQFAFAMSNGGAPMIRKLIFHEYNRKMRTDPEVLENSKEYEWGEFGSNGKRINIRLYPALQVFVRRLGGAPYVRALLASYMEYRKQQSNS